MLSICDAHSAAGRLGICSRRYMRNAELLLTEPSNTQGIVPFLKYRLKSVITLLKFN
jgi:hypothetical protein